MSERAICTICGKDALCHPISFDSVGESYVDTEAGDMLCNACFVKETKRLTKGGK